VRLETIQTTALWTVRPFDPEEPIVRWEKELDELVEVGVIRDAQHKLMEKLRIVMDKAQFNFEETKNRLDDIEYDNDVRKQFLRNMHV